MKGEKFCTDFQNEKGKEGSEEDRLRKPVCVSLNHNFRGWCSRMATPSIDL